MGYSTEVEFAGDVDPDAGERLLAILDEIAPETGPAVSVGRDSFAVRLTVDERDPLAACSMIMNILDAAAHRGGIPVHEMRVDALSTETEDHLERRVQIPGSVLVGVSEIAAMLGVSRQRVDQLRDRSDFPRPVAELAAGPVWHASMLERFVAAWTRRPGRPTHVDELIREAANSGEAAISKVLTAREAEVFTYIVEEGLSTREIARRLDVKPETVRAYARRILEKLNADREAQAGTAS